MFLIIFESCFWLFADFNVDVLSVPHFTYLKAFWTCKWGRAGPPKLSSKSEFALDFASQAIQRFPWIISAARAEKGTVSSYACLCF